MPEGMVDVHAHILRGVDDGAETLDESLAMARLAAASGTAIMVATPHLGESAPGSAAVFGERLRELRGAIATSGIPLDVRLGCEARFLPDVGARLLAGEVPTLAGSRYVLLEWPPLVPPQSDHALFDLQLKGYRAVLAHVERYRFVQTDVNMLVGLIERGALVQVTAGSLLGHFGPEARRTAEILVEHRMAHVIASDAHSAGGDQALAFRLPTLVEAVERVATLVGADAARALAVDVPRAIVDNRLVDVEPPEPYRPRPAWAFWRRDGR